MRKLFYAACLLISVVTFSCKPDEPEKPNPENGNLKIMMDVTAGGKAFLPDSLYRTADGQEYTVELLKFYLSNIALVKDDGSTVNVKDIVLVDLEDNLKEPFDPNAVGTTFTYAVPAAKYNAVKFGIGVPKSMNVSSNDYPNEHPLSVYRGTDWSWAGYRFIMLQGKARNGNTGNLSPFEYHIAEDTFYQNLQFDKNIEITANNTQALVIHLDIDKIFRPADASQKIDPVSENLTHTTDNTNLAWKVDRNFMKAISL
jgi:hypothetical protein